MSRSHCDTIYMLCTNSIIVLLPYTVMSLRDPLWFKKDLNWGRGLWEGGRKRERERELDNGEKVFWPYCLVEQENMRKADPQVFINCYLSLGEARGAIPL